MRVRKECVKQMNERTSEQTNEHVMLSKNNSPIPALRAGRGTMKYMN